MGVHKQKPAKQDHNRCFKCSESGHYSNEYPNSTKADFEEQFLTPVIMMRKTAITVVISPNTM